MYYINGAAPLWTVVDDNGKVWFTTNDRRAAEHFLEVYNETMADGNGVLARGAGRE